MILSSRFSKRLRRQHELKKGRNAVGDGTKLVIALVLIVVAVIVIGGKFKSKFSKDDVAAMSQKVTRIDENDPYEVFIQTVEEWEEDGQKDGKYMNPNTKAYTVVAPMVCRSCTKRIPLPPAAVGTDPAAIRELEATYKCPKCEDLAFHSK
jgi:hypothetical protein